MADREPVLYGKYQLLERLARGGMAEVFKAKSHGVEGFEKILVIKRILPELGANPRFVDMFINEAKIAVTLSHANIVQVFDLGRADETYFIAMEYVAGLDLASVLDLCREHGKRLPHEMSAYIASEVAKGLDYAHRRRDSQMRPLGIVHRDVSPQNVLLSYEGEVKLTDFGIARARNIVHEVSEVGVLKGKYAYMAPEQARDEGVDSRTDLFALAVVLYEMLSGTNPYMDPSAYETLKRVQQGTAPSLRDVTPDVPEELALIVERGMRVAPDERYDNAGTLYEELIQYLYGSRMRVGAHDVAAFLEELRALGTPRRPSGEHASLRAAFDADVRGPPAHTRQTPVEVPSTRVSTPGGRPSSRPRRRRSSMPLPNAERRDVTAIALVAGCDEPIRESSLRALIRRFGGVLVEQGFAPDEEAQGRWLVALFGARDPDGHDTESAVRCAVRMASAAATAAGGAGGTTAQLGVHAGRVLFDLSGELLRDERYDRLVGTARALAQRAAAGQVLLSASAVPPVQSLFVLGPEPEAGEGVQSVGPERQDEDPGPFIGRREELRRIGESLAFAARGQQRVVLLTGDPGSGKTRLLAEVRRRLRLGGHDVGMHLAQIPRSNREVPLSGCQEVLRAILGIGELDAEPVVREKVSRVRELGLTQPELEAVETVLGLGSGAADGTIMSERPVRAAFARIATRLAQDRLTIFVLDGVENVDEGSAAILRRLLREPRSARILVVLSCRSGTEGRWTELGDLHHIELGPLEDEEVARLVSVRLGGAEAPPELLKEMFAKSGGNPLFVDEYLKALIDAEAVEVTDPSNVTYRPEVAAVEVPKTLRGIVGSRLARLDPAERNLLQVASVVGSRFSAPVLALVAAEAEVVVEDLLEGLERRDIIRRHGSNEHAFAHELVGEVLRNGLTPEDRSDLHGAVAAALEELYPAHVDEMAERLAHHYREAGNLSKAAEHLVRAADRLESEQVLAGAIANLAEAIALLSDDLSTDRDRVLSLYRRIGDLSFRSRELEAGARHMGEALELAEGVGRDDYVARFAMMRGRLLVNAHRVTEGRPWLDRARQVARQLGKAELLRDVTLATAEAHTRTGEWGRAVALFREALDLSRDTGDVQAQIHCVIPLAHAYAGVGDREHALETLEEARRLVAQHPDRYTECELHKTASLVHHFLGEHALALETAGRGLELAKEYGFGYEMAVNAHNIGETYLRLGDYKRAFANLRYSYEVAREHGLVKLQVADMRVLGFIDAVKFGSEEGRERVLEACEYAAEHGHVWDLIQSKFYLALIDHLRGSHATSAAGYREVIRLSAEHGNRHYEQDAERALAALQAGGPAPLPG